MNRFQQIDWAKTKMESFNLFTKLIRTKDPNADEQTHEIPAAGGKRRLTKCLTTLDLTSLGVGSCVGTGMYLVTGMVARKVAGPGVVISFIIAAIASIFSGACYAEFGVRVPHTTGSAYMYSYVKVGEFIAFVIGWNMVLEYLIGTSACARALSACFNSLVNGAISNFMVSKVGTIFGRPPDFIACGITLLMMIVMITGVRKSLIFNNVLNVINFTVWVFIMTAGMFYVDTNNWTQHHGFLPFGWSGVFTGAATCFYAFIGFDIIATTGEEAHNPKRSIPLAIVTSLAIILCAYVTSAMMLTLIVPYDRVDEDSALVEMFAHVKAPTCKYIVAVGAVAGLTVSMFGSMFPMPRIVYAMAQDGLIFRQLSAIWEATGTPGLATLVGGLAAALVALLIRLEVLVEMMSIGTLLAYTLVSTCVLILRYQPHSTNLIELLPHSLRTPIVDPAQPAALDDLPVYRETTFGGFPDLGGQTRILSSNQHVMVRRVTRSSPDSDDTFPGDEGDDYGRDDQFLVQDNTENKFYGTVHGTPASAVGGRSSIGPALDSIGRKLQALTYLCPGLLPWVDLGPATDNSGFFVMKAVGVLYILIIIFDLFAAYGSPAASPTTATLMTVLVIAMFVILMMISRKPQNRNPMLYMTPGLPFVPAIAITVNIYLILNLSILTLVRFTVWMIIGLFMYFKYGIINSTLEQEQAKAQEDPQPPPITSVLSHKVIPPRKEITPDQHSRNIFQGDRMFGSDGFKDPLLAWEESSESTPQKSSNQYKHVEQRYNEKTNNTSSHVSTSSSRPTWANTDYSAWND